jgi:serine/threonine-protein kinase PknK
MPEPRAAGGAAAVARRLYVAGGVRGDGLATMMMVFDPSSRSWSTVEGPPTRGEHLGVAASSGRLYVMGGRTGDLQSGVGASESYDPGAGTWTRWPSMPVPRGGLAATATANGLIVMAGGRAAGFSFSDVNEALDLAAYHSVG